MHVTGAAPRVATPGYLDAVGIKLDGQALPTTATCPICGDMLTIDLDLQRRERVRLGVLRDVGLVPVADVLPADRR